jgi:hypothetical protein
MSNIQTIKALIDLWPSRAELAGDLDTSVDRVHKWAKPGGSIPAWFHADLLRAASARGFTVSADDLVRLHDKQRAA